MLSIANPNVHHSAVHTGLTSNKEFSILTLPKSVLRQPATSPEGHWLSPFPLPLHATSGDTPARLAYHKNLAIRIGAHRAPIYVGMHLIGQDNNTQSGFQKLRPGVP
jgi:hypothetical protein